MPVANCRKTSLSGQHPDAGIASQTTYDARASSRASEHMNIEQMCMDKIYSDDAATH